jgi:hypothetical protein
LQFEEKPHKEADPKKSAAGTDVEWPANIGRDQVKVARQGMVIELGNENERMG